MHLCVNTSKSIRHNVGFIGAHVGNRILRIKRSCDLRLMRPWKVKVMTRYICGFISQKQFSSRYQVSGSP